MRKRKEAWESRLDERRVVVRNPNLQEAVHAIGVFVGVALLVFSTVAFSASNAIYTYDALGRLTKIAYSDGAMTTTVSYSYDATGNRTSVVSTAPS